MPLPQPSALTLLVLLPLLGWRIYSRVKRLVGRQRFSRVRPWVTLTLFPLLIAGLALATLASPARLVLLLAGVAGGVALGRLGLRKTRFEATAQGLFYTPNAHLGIALSLLFLGRVLYRVVQVFVLSSAGPQSLGDFGRSPVTLAIFGVLAGYYVTYAVGLLRWQFGVEAAQRGAEGGA